MDDFEQRLKDIRDRLEDRVAQAKERIRREAEELKARKGVSITPLFTLMPAPSKGPLYLTSELAFLDDLAEEHFYFGRLLGRGLRTYPIVLCQTNPEFYKPLVDILNIPESEKEKYIKELEDTVKEEGTPRIGELGVHWPGLGCFINGLGMAKLFGVDISELLKQEKSQGLIVSTVLHEKLGHGFISEFSAWGKERRRLHLERYEAARRFNLRKFDSPSLAALGNKWELLFHSSKLCEEGYAEWIESFLRGRWQGTKEAAPKYSTEQVTAALSGLEGLSKDEKATVEALVEDWHTLFSDEEINPGRVLQIVLEMQAADGLLEELMAFLFGQPLRYIAGCLLLDKAARNLGDSFAPYAVLIANNIEYNLERSSLSDLSYFLRQRPELNIDARLAMIAQLKLDKSLDIHHKSGEINRRLGFAIPGFF